MCCFILKTQKKLNKGETWNFKKKINTVLPILIGVYIKSTEYLICHCSISDLAR